jgi:glycosidase
LLNRTRKLIKLKHTEPALVDYAEFIPLYAKENAYPFIYARARDNDVVLVLLNPSGKEVTAEFELNITYKKTVVLAGKELQLNKADNKITLTMPGQTYSIVRLE